MSLRHRGNEVQNACLDHLCRKEIANVTVLLINKVDSVPGTAFNVRLDATVKERYVP